MVIDLNSSADSDQRPGTALVLFSGGQDSAVCLAWALTRFEHVETVGFDYGQRHRVELFIRVKTLEAMRARFPHWDARLGPDRVLNLGLLSDIGGEALTSEAEIRMGEEGLPTTFVPGRNLLFLTSAAALAYRRGADTLVGGMCETDFSGYPDCRRTTLDAQEQALCLGMARDITIETPLMHLNKAQTWALARELGGSALVDLIVEETHTCYRGDRSKRHVWGYGCGECPACDLRAKGWADWQQAA